MAAVVAIMAVVDSVMPALSRANSSMVAASDAINDRISSQVEIIHATGIVSATQANAWVKNVGASLIGPLDHADVFFGPEDNFNRIPYGGPSCTAPCLDYQLEGGATEWEPTVTPHIIIYLDYSLTTGTTYFVKVVAPNGISDAKFFSV